MVLVLDDLVERQLDRGLATEDLEERELLAGLADWFASEFAPPYRYEPLGAWDVRNARQPESSDSFHASASDRA